MKLFHSAGRQKKTGTDMTQGSPFRLIMAFALPLFIGNIFQQFYNVVDSVVVGRFVGSQALAAVGCSGTPFGFFMTLIQGFTAAASVLISQAYGAGNEENQRRAYGTSAVIILTAGILLTAIGISIARPLLILLKTPENILDQAVIYLRTVCTGILATCLYNMMASCLRAVGNSMIPLYALILTSLLNVLLDLVFVIAFGMGVFGVALATVLAQLISGVFCFFYAVGRFPQFAPGNLLTGFHRQTASEVFRIGIPSSMQSSIVSISAMCMQRAVNSHGSVVTAAYTVGNRAEQLFFCLSFAIGLAVGTFSGQNAGAGRYDRVERGHKAGFVISTVYTALTAAVLIPCAPWFFRIFTTDAEVISIAVPFCRITAAFAPVLGMVFIYQNLLRSCSDIAPTVWMSITEVLSRAVLPFVFSALWGYTGIWWATPVGWTASAIIGYLRFRSGKWKEKSRRTQERLERA